MNDPFEQVAARVVPGGQLVRAWPLTGGISAQTTAIEVATPGGASRRFVVRMHNEADLAADPQTTANEFALLTRLESVGLPTPPPVHFEESSALLGRPFVVLELIDGATDLAPVDVPGGMEQMAATMALIHTVDVDGLGLWFLPRGTAWFKKLLVAQPDQLDDSVHEGRLRDALNAAWPIPQANDDALLHRDFWPGNLLWRDRRLVGVIDWEVAALGDPLIDLAITRLDIMCAFGPDAIELFEQHYRRARPELDIDSLVHWDLFAALRMGPNISRWSLDTAHETSMRTGIELFIQRAFSELSER